MNFPIEEFLDKNNRLPAKKIEFVLPSYARTNSSAKLEITAERPSKSSSRLTLAASAETVDALRTLDWKRFRELQEEFAGFLLRRSGPAYPLARPAARFNDFGGKLREFWLECLDDAGFGKFQQRNLAGLPRRSPNALRLPDGKLGTAEEPGSDGVKMGAIPLQVGMRLVIHWGGTTMINYGGAPTFNVTRQTSSGVTSVNLVRRGRAIVLGPMNDWKLRTLAPYQAADGNAPGLPFGKGPDAEFSGKVVPVFNEHDLHYLTALLTPSGPEGKAQPATNLTLLIPYEYTKADSGTNQAKQFTNDALAGNPNDERIRKSLSRRFILWGSETPYSETLMPSFDRTEVQNWTVPAMVFGNQSWVDVECGISINSTAMEWVPLGSTLADLLESHARWALDRNPSSDGVEALARLRRSTKPDGDHAGYEVREYRFWGVPSKQAAQIELHPGDSLDLKP